MGKNISKNINETKSQKSQRIIKRNKWKIIIISSIILILIIGISVGLYFAFKTPPFNLNTKNIKIAKIDEVRKDILNEEGNNIGLYFYEEDKEITNYLMWANKEGMSAKEEDRGKGPLSIHIDNPSSINITWYAVNISENPSKIITDLFLYENKNDIGQKEYVTYDAFEPFFNGGVDSFNIPESNSHYIINAQYSEEPKENEIENKHDEFDGIKIENAYSSNPTIDWSISDGTTMWFDGLTGQVMSVIESYSTPENQSAEDYSDFNAMINNWWEEIEKGIWIT